MAKISQRYECLGAGWNAGGGEIILLSAGLGIRGGFLMEKEVIWETAEVMIVDGETDNSWPHLGQTLLLSATSVPHLEQSIIGIK